MIYKRDTRQRGFSLVETLVAITIVLIVIVGPMTIVSTASRSTTFSGEQVTAFFLAQEGAELAQKARDNLVLEDFDDSGGSWEDFNDPGGEFAPCFSSGFGCGLQVDNRGVVDVRDCASSANACRLYLDSSEGPIIPYSHDSAIATSTPYTRTIEFEEINSNEIRVVSRVEWFSGLARDGQSVQVQTSLFNVYDPS